MFENSVWVLGLFYFIWAPCWGEARVSERVQLSKVGFPYSLFACMSSPILEDTKGIVKGRSSTYWSHPPLEGFLLKKGAKGINPKYKRRWFILRDSKLYYYKSSDTSTANHRGYIDLTAEYTLETSDGDTINFRIRTHDRTWHLAANAEEEYNFWVQGLSSFKRRQQKGPLKENFFNQRFDSFSSTIHDDDDPNELKELLLDAESELEAKQHHVDDLYADLQNSLQVIKLRGEQIDLLNSRLQEKEREIQTLKNGGILSVPEVPCPVTGEGIVIDESSDSSGDDTLDKPIESKEEEGEVVMVDLSTDMTFLQLLQREMECFAVYLEDNEPPGSAKIAIEKWIESVKEQRGLL